MRRPWLAATLFVYCIGAAVMMQLQVPFGIASTLFLFVSILTIKRCDRAIILPAALCSSALGFGLTYFFGTLFGVDLP